MNQEIPATEYGRLLMALGLEPDYETHGPQRYRVTQLLEVRMFLVSDCERRGFVVTDALLNAAGNRGINPEFIKKGTFPVWLDA